MKRVGVTALIVAAGLVPLLWPGDTPWINDEPLFLRKALAGGLASEGLRGTVGLTYGPMAVWIYALLLQITRDPIGLVVLRAALFMSITIAALAWLAAVMRRPRALVLLPLLSPYLWLYARLLWDTWLIPLGALGFASYAAFNARPSRATFSLTLILLVACAIDHPMVGPFVIAVVAHALCYHRGWMGRNWRTVAISMAVGGLIAAPWLLSAARELSGAAPVAIREPAPLLQPTPDPQQPWWMPFVFPLLGGRLLSAQGIDYFFGDPWFARARWVLPFALATHGAHLLVWMGMGIAGWRVREGLRRRRPRDLDFHVSWVACATVALGWLLQATAQRHTHPHYYMGAWSAFVWFAWTTISSLPRRAGIAAGGGLVASLGVVLGFLVVDIHHTAGNRELHFGSTLTTQMEVARRIGRAHPEAALRIEVLGWLMFPHALPVLRELVAAPGDPAGSHLPLRVRYRDPGGRDGWLTVDEAR
ncbi:MAG: hypothetical protein EXR72_18935 [Myxococcales bacterium]|nr:hypothetical protein [Myxococcales bacterium]